MLTRRGVNGPVVDPLRPPATGIPPGAAAAAGDVLEKGLLSNDVTVSDPGEGNGRSAPAEGAPEVAGQAGEQAPEAASVLANLPRTRPQRASARRAAARAGAARQQGSRQEAASANGNGRPPQRKAPAAKRPARAAAGASSAAGSGRAGASRAKAQRPKQARPARGRTAEEVPRQGYESVEERATGPVQPPGGTELIGTAAEIVGEIAKAGLSGGERVVRDLLSRLGH